MKKTFSLLCVLVLFTQSLHAFQIPVADYMKRGDDFAAQFNHRQALEQYESVLNMDTGNYEAAWKASRELSAIGNNLEETAEAEEIEATYARAVEMAQKGISLDSNGVDAHFYMAVAKGRLGLYKGKKEMIQLSKDVKIHVDQVLALDKDYYKAYYLIGRWHDKIANVNWILKQFAKIIYGGLPPASNEEALENFRTAIRLNPEYVECHKELGRFYMDRKEWASAVEVLETCLTLPETEEHDARFKREAAELLNEARGKVR
ncbi:hypothetical protein ACFL6I_14635 [candidate division KSB1 bacterium]